MSNSKVAVVEQVVSDSSLIERAENACVESKRLEKIGDYEAAYEVVAEYWPDRSSMPVLPELPQQLKGDLLLRIGALSCWLGSANQTTGGQELGKDIIGKALSIYEALNEPAKVAEARGDLGLCYWREGAFDEARIQFATALGSVPESEADLRAVLLIRSGIVEGDAHRLNSALVFYNQASPLVEKSHDEALKGGFHFSYGLLFKRMAAPENREEYIDRALVEYTAASFHFEQAGNVRAQARVENNLGNLFSMIGRYQDAHRHLDRARSLFLELDDPAAVAVVDETRGRTLLGEGRLVEAERMIKMAVKGLEKGDEQAVLADGLTTYGIVQARLGYHSRAKVLLERAIYVAETMGDREGAGRAQLSIIEELRDKLPQKELVGIYRSAAELLKRGQDPDATKRLLDAAGALLEMLSTSEQTALKEPETFEGFSLKEYLKVDERKIISRALREAGGSVTKASKLLGFKHHQSLVNIINGRHRDLLGERATVRKRKRHLLSHSTETVDKVIGPGVGGVSGRRRVLYVGDTATLGKLSGSGLFQGSDVQAFSALVKATSSLTEASDYGVVVVGCGFEVEAVIEFVNEVRVKVRGHGRVPIVVCGPLEFETALWRAGVAAFVSPDQGASGILSAIDRILKQEDPGK